MIAVTFALPAESCDFIRLLRHRTPDKGLGRMVSGLFRGKEVRVLHTGVGAAAARENVGNFLGENSPRLLISAGFAGALTHEFEPGDLLLASNYSTPKLLSAARTVLYGKPVHTAKLASSAVMIDSAEERENLAKTTKAMAVDMETESIAEVCLAASVPLLSLRAITDTPEHPFPAPAEVLFDLARQKTNISRLALYLATHPHRIIRLAAFGRRVARARRSLTEGLELLLGSEPAE